MNKNNIADLIIVRPMPGGIQTAFVRYDNGKSATFNLGLSTAIPQIGNFNGGGTNTFAWHQRDQGLVGVRRQDGTDNIFPLGIATNAIVRADGTVVQPTSSDSIDFTPQPPPPPPPSGECRQFGGNEIWKPRAETRGGVPVFLVSSSLVFLLRRFGSKTQAET